MPRGQGLADGMEKGLRRVFSEFEAGALIHGIRQAAGGAHDGHGAIAQAVHLVEPARLVTAGHQEHIGAGFDAVRQRIVVTDVHGDFRRVVLGETAE